MPYIKTTTNVSVSAEKEETIKKELGQAIEIIPGKAKDGL